MPAQQGRAAAVASAASGAAGTTPGGAPGEDTRKVVAIFDAVDNTTGEIVTSVCVAGTGIRETVHALSGARRRGKCPSVLFSDNWPNDKLVLAAIFAAAEGRLDVFHWMRRITRLLREYHCDFSAAQAALSPCVFCYDESDITAVDKALEDGTLNGTKHTRQQISDLKKSGLYWR